MKILLESQVEKSAADRVFRHSPFRALVVWLAAFLGAAAMLFNAATGKWKPGYIFGSFLMLFVLLMLRLVTARFHPSNWLVRMNDIGLYVQYRSYLNYELSADDPSVVFVSYGEIASARLVKERLQTPDPMRPRTTQTQYLRYVELELSGDTAALVSALSNERGESAPMKKRWYGGSSSTLYQDYPLSMNTPPFLRIRWDVVPRSAVFLKALRPYTVIAETVHVHQDFTRTQSLGREEQEKQLRELAQRGDVIAAVYAARKIHQCGLAEAKKIVEDLQSSAGIQGDGA